LSYLRRFRFDKIKIDQSFIQGLTQRANTSLAIVRSIVALATSLGIATTAEGVETTEQFERARAEGCTEVQGFLLGTPRPLCDVLPKIEAERRAPQRDIRGARAS
jgi:EAL domain-containing protein (putative c-di-GMP-specific phosphodiesterase class I)